MPVRESSKRDNQKPFFKKNGEGTFFKNNQAEVPKIQTFLPMGVIEAVRQAGVEATYHPFLEKVGKAGKRKSSRGRRARRKATLELANFARSQITDTKLIDMYLQRTDLTDIEKTKTLGEIVVKHGKIEFLLSRIYAGGKGNLELGGKDKGAFPNRYQEEIGAGSKGGFRWCTSFAGYLYHKLGLAPGETKQSKSFLSGYRLRKWALTGKGVGRKQKNKEFTPKDQQIATLAQDPKSGSALIDKSDWRKLRKDIAKVNRTTRKLKRSERKAKRLELKKGILTAFFAAKPSPQAGDILIVGGKNNEFKSGAHSHTTLVESFDSSEFIVSTIEGNIGGRITGKVYNLKNASTLKKFIFLLRMGSKSADTPAGTPARKVDPFELSLPMNDIIRVLTRFASHPDRKWIKSADPTATTAESIK